MKFKIENNNYTIWDSTPISYIVDPELDSPDFRHFEKNYRQIKKGNY
jgi:hypothetical protein